MNESVSPSSDPSLFASSGAVRALKLTLVWLIVLLFGASQVLLWQFSGELVERYPAISGRVALAGRFHPLVIHFPIALFVTGVVMEIVQWIRGRAAYSAQVRFLIVGGAVTGVAAAVLGWMNAVDATYGGLLAGPFFLHKWLGSGAAFFMLASVGFGETHRARQASGAALSGYLFRLICVGSAVVIATAAHFGGVLVYGPDYLPF